MDYIILKTICFHDACVYTCVHLMTMKNLLCNWSWMES